MKRRLVWARAARNDFREALAFIASDNEAAARKVRATIGRAARALADKPTGRPGRVSGTYEKSVTGLRYVIAYAIHVDRGGTETVAILRVIHTSRDWQARRWPPES